MPIEGGERNGERNTREKVTKVLFTRDVESERRRVRRSRKK
jgi:hypothetical protein